MNLSVLNPFRKVTEMKARTGTKFVVINFIITMTIVFFVSVVLPILSIWFEVIVTVIEKINPSSIIIALLGQSGISTVANTVRIAIENSKGIQNGKVDNLME